MENTLTEIKSSLVQHTDNTTLLLEKSIRLMDAQELSIEVQKNISILQERASNTNFYQTKLTVGSAALRESEVNHISFTLEIPATFFGEIYEKFTWAFDIEGNSDVGKLENIVYEQTLRIQNKTANAQEKNLTGVRMYSLLALDEKMKEVFDTIDAQLNYTSDEYALLLTSLAFYEMELLSSQREEDYLLHKDMYNLSNLNDRWLACMNVQVKYIRPSVEYMSHLVH